MDPRFEHLRQLLKHFEARRARAAARLEAVPGQYSYFAIIGLNAAVEHYEIGTAEEMPIAILQRVVEPPGEVELAAALRDTHLMGAIGRYSSGITYELAVDQSFGSEGQAANTLAWWVVSALRVRTLAEILIPAVADHSWSTIAAVTNNTCDAQLLEDVPRAHRLEAAREVAEADLDWVVKHVNSFAGLLEKPSFRLATDALCTHHHEPNVRMMVAVLWAGIEACFGFNAELRFRLATTVAALLERRGEARAALYRHVKKLYDVRSQVVHGGDAANENLREHVKEVRSLLSRLLCSYVEAGGLPTKGDVEQAIFG